MNVVPVVIVHGGAGPMGRLEGEAESVYRRGMLEAARAGLARLVEGGSAVDAVEAATHSMEVSGDFNAGAGGCLDEEGRATLDAAIMRGEDLQAGAVGALMATHHAVAVARSLLDEGRHVLLVGEGADRRAKKLGLPAQPPVDAARRKAWERLLAQREREGHEPEERLAASTPRGGDGYERFALEDVSDTVGAIAVDARGRVAAAVSTGGLWLKAPGRVGDSALVGGGLYASDESGGAAVATGIGERILRVTLTKVAVDLLARGASAEEAARGAIEVGTKRFGPDTAGLIVADRQGRVAAHFDTRGMGRAYARADGKHGVGVWREETF